MAGREESNGVALRAGADARGSPATNVLAGCRTLLLGERRSPAARLETKASERAGWLEGSEALPEG